MRVGSSASSTRRTISTHGTRTAGRLCIWPRKTASTTWSSCCWRPQPRWTSVQTSVRRPWGPPSLAITGRSWAVFSTRGPTPTERTAADWPTAEGHLARGLALSEELGERRLWEENASIQAKALQFQGRLVEAEAQWRVVTDAAVVRNAEQIVAWGQLSVAWNLAWQGRADEAIEYMAPELTRSDTSDIAFDVLWARGIDALVRLGSGDPGAARASAELALAKMSTAQPYPYFMLPAIAASTWVFLSLAEAAEGAERKALIAAAAKSVKNLRFVGKFFPFARPVGSLMAASLDQLRGKPARAAKGWADALSNLSPCLQALGQQP